jgi:hypothetical protein
MRALGRLTTVVLIAGLAVVVSFGWRSRGELERYLKMRRM